MLPGLGNIVKAAFVDLDAAVSIGHDFGFQVREL